MQKITWSSYARKETVDIDIFVTSRNSDRKIMQSIRITDSGVTLLLEHSPSRASDIIILRILVTREKVNLT